MKKVLLTPKKVEKIVEVVTEHESIVVEDEGGPVTLLGKDVYISCTSYAYSGKLTGVNDKYVELSEPHIVYETGPWDAKKWKDAQKLPCSKTVIFLAQVEQMFAVER